MTNIWQVNIYKINQEEKLIKKVFLELKKNDYYKNQTSLKSILKTDGTRYNPLYILAANDIGNYK